MTQTMMRRALHLAACAAFLLPGAAQAHRQWMLPSATVLSGDDSWVTVDAAVSNDLFYFDHQPLRLDALAVTMPDGTAGKVENSATGRYRSTFDVHLTQPGTWRIASVTNGVMGSYMLNGEQKRLPRGTTKATLAAAIPAGATNVRTAEVANRNELFVTLGAPTATLFKPSGVGLEMVPITHPNDLIVGEPATFQFLLDGQPAAGLGVTVIPGGSRYRDAVGEMDLETDAQGKVAITWPNAGMYWLNVSTGGRRGGEGGDRPDGEAEGKAQGRSGAEASRPVPAADDGPARRASYATTLEVLAP